MIDGVVCRAGRGGQQPPSRSRHASAFEVVVCSVGLGPLRSASASATAAPMQRQVGEGLREVADHPLAHRGRTPRRAGRRRWTARRSRSISACASSSRPARGVRRDQPERAGQERVLVAGEPVDAGLRCGSAAAARRASGPPRRPRWCRASAGRRRRGSRRREHQQRGVDLVGVVVLGEGVALARRSRASAPPRAPGRAARATARPGRRGRAARPRATARSKAAHTITREWVKCRSGPRISHSPLSGSSQCRGQLLDQRPLQRPGVVGVASTPACPGQLEGDHHLAEDVGLPLVHGAVADPHRPRAGVAGQVVERRARAARGAPSTAYMICRSSGSPATARSSQSRHSRASSVVAGRQQRLEGQGGVAQPAVAVVPVALAAEVLGQRGRRRRDDAAGAAVGEQPQREQRADDRRAVGARRSRTAPAHRSLELDRLGRPGARRPGVRACGWCEANQVVEKVSSSPSATSNSSTWRPSTACGSRGPRRTSHVGAGDRRDHLVAVPS